MSKPYELCLRLSQAERERLETSAKQCGLSKSDYLRKLLNGIPVRARPSPEVRALRKEINRIGVNVNQIARKVNAHLGAAEDIRACQQLLADIYRLMYQIANP